MAVEASLRDLRRQLQAQLEREPSDKSLFLQLTEVTQQLGDYDSLLQLLNERIVGSSPDEDILLRRADVFRSLGEFNHARVDYLKILQSQPCHAEAILALVNQGQGDEIGGLARVEQCRETFSEDSAEHIRLGYARGKLLEEQCRYREAFQQLREVNRAQAGLGGMNLDAKLRGAHIVIDDLQPQIIERCSGYGHTSDRPVFIVGMPRSGTTLTEQILGRHPQVYPAGEQLFWGDILRDLVSRATAGNQSLVEAIHRVDSGAWKAAGEQYLGKMLELDDTALRTTDKLPANFALLPMVRLVFPNARIIHLRRNPLATICSCIRTAFGELALAFTVEDWARFYGLYQGLMDRWRPLLGEQLLEIDYEDLVSDFPNQVHRLIAFLGLSWDEACLTPEQYAGPVRTASFKQVRRSVHSQAVEAWKCYQVELEALQPLIEETRQLVLATAAD